ncbi:alpha-ketoglutarate decarboxylase [Salinimicrobium soli]|uniref:alpha-ketoglutarate decarboxylase n=1 Tax=Salinimicrobium soli TaxID=1254399 RepID=UPI003AAE4F80
MFNKKKVFFFSFLFLAIHFQFFGQNATNPESSFFDHVRFGGSLGVSFSNGNFGAALAPKGIYDFNRYASAGIGIAGTYTNGSNYTAFTTGGSLIGLFRPIPVIQLSSEFEQNYVSQKWELEGANRKDSYSYPALFLGAGYTTGPVTVGLRYDVIYDDEKSIYPNALMPFVTIFF